MIWETLVLSTLICGAFFIGLYIGSKSKKEVINELSNINPIKIIQENKIKKEIIETESKEQEKIAVMLENIENYDGTGLGQKDLPN